MKTNYSQMTEHTDFFFLQCMFVCYYVIASNCSVRTPGGEHVVNWNFCRQMAKCRMFVQYHTGGRDQLLWIGMPYGLQLCRLLQDVLLVMIPSSWWWDAVNVITVWW
jgi:hypothetical protein